MADFPVRQPPDLPSPLSGQPGGGVEPPVKDDIPPLGEAEDFGFAHLPERDFFALSLDATLLPVELPALAEGEDETEGEARAEAEDEAQRGENGEEKRHAEQDGKAGEHGGPGNDDSAPAREPDESAILATMTKLVKEVAAESGGVRRKVLSPPAPPAAPDDAAASKAGEFGADMSATLSELEKILVELTDRKPAPPAPAPSAVTPGPRPYPSRRAPRAARRPARAPLSVTAYALANAEDELLPLPETDKAPFVPETPAPQPAKVSGPPVSGPSVSGPSWDSLWTHKIAREQPQPSATEPVLLSPFSFIPPEDEEQEPILPLPANPTDDGGQVPAEAPTDDGSGSPASSAPTTEPAPASDAERPARPRASQAVPPAKASVGHPAKASPSGTPQALQAAAPSPGRPPAPRGDEAAQRTLAELRRLLTTLNAPNAPGTPPRSPAPAAGPPPVAARKNRRPATVPTPQPASRQKPATDQSAASPTPVPTPSAVPTPKPAPEAAPSPAASTAAPAAQRPDAEPVSTPPDTARSATTMADETPAQAQQGGPTAATSPEASPEATPTTLPEPPTDLSVPASALPRPSAPEAHAPEKRGQEKPAPKKAEAPSSWLGRLANRLKRVLRPESAPPARTARGVAPQAPLAAAPFSPEPAATPAPSPADAPPAGADQAGGLIRRLRDMEAEHRARLQALSERPRGPVYPSWEARRHLLNISLAADAPETARRSPRVLSGDEGSAGSDEQALRVLLNRPSALQRLSRAVRARLSDASFREGLKAVGGVAALTAMVGVALYAALHPDQMDRVLNALSGLLPKVLSL